MRFSVNTTALPGLAQSLDRRWQDLQNGHDYLLRHTRIPAAQAGILNWLCGHHEQVVAAVGDFLDQAAERYAGPYAIAITEANLYYRRTDLGAAAGLDATLPMRDDPGKHDVRSYQADQGLGAEVFTDDICPANRYIVPADYHARYSYDFAAFDALSPTSDVRELIWQVSQIAVDFGLLDHPYDVIDEAVKPLSGDWAAFAACADVYANIAYALDDDAGCLTGGVSKIDQVWTGNAADACSAGLARFAGDLRAATAPLRATATSYTSAAEQIRAQAEVLAALLTTLIDEVVETALDAATEGAFAPLQVATTVEDVVKTIWKLRKVVRIAWDIARAFAETGRVSGADLGIIGVDHPLPALTADLPSLPRLATTAHAALN